MIQGEVALWRAVILQAFLDAVAKKSCTDLDTQSANKWLSEDSEAFRKVCNMANLCPIRVRKAYTRRINDVEGMLYTGKRPKFRRSGSRLSKEDKDLFCE